MGDKAAVFRRHIMQASPEHSFCAGCNTCEIVCSLTHDGLVGPGYNRIYVEKDIRNMYHAIHVCRHCLTHPCYDACPRKGEAMIVDEAGIVYVVEEKCNGCGLCQKACIFDPNCINIVKSADKNLRKAKKCDLCRERDGGPACVEWCPVRCLSVSDAEMEVAGV